MKVGYVLVLLKDYNHVVQRQQVVPTVNNGYEDVPFSDLKGSVLNETS